MIEADVEAEEIMENQVLKPRKATNYRLRSGLNVKLNRWPGVRVKERPFEEKNFTSHSVAVVNWRSFLPKLQPLAILSLIGLLLIRLFLFDL
jgi:hypothetical protein